MQCERALDLLTRLVATMGPACWDYHSGHEDFNAVMAKFCGDFASSSDVDKFALCDTIRTVIRSFPKTCFSGDDDAWLPGLQRGLRDILFSKISRAQRDPALKLVSAVVEASRDEAKQIWKIQAALNWGKKRRLQRLTGKVTPTSST